MQQLKVKLYAM